MKNVLIHVKNDEAINTYVSLLKNETTDKEHSREVIEMIKEFYNNGWGVYLTTIESFKDGVWNNIYSINENKKIDMNIEQLNNVIDFMIIRNIGSVEGKFNIVKDYLDFIIDNYKGVALNNPISMKKGMTKNYLAEIDENELEDIGIHIIPTKIYETDVEYSEITSQYEDLSKYLIKPLTGELSNSLACLKDIDEDFLRRKEKKVGGWIIQPIKNEIWDGEYQMMFIGEELIYSQKKNYPKSFDSTLPVQKKRVIEKYKPTEQEILIGKKLIEYFKELYGIKIDICRIDFMKNGEGKPILIEFEMVNPGFFIGYMKEDDEEIKNIVRRIRNYCENYKLTI